MAFLLASDIVVVQAKPGENERLEKQFLEVANKVAKMNEAETEQQKTTTEEGGGVEYSITDQSIENYTETQYNNFGWIRANDVISAAEYNALMSNYTGHKHKDDSFPITRFSETVVHSFQHPDILMYVKGNIRSPQITKVVCIDAEDSKTVLKIKENIFKNERAQIFQPYSFIRDYYGDEILIIDRKRDYASFQEYRAEQERGNGEKANTYGGAEQNRGRSSTENTRNDELNFSLPENPIPLEFKSDIEIKKS